MNNQITPPSFNSHRCTACWKCVEACPRHAIRKVKFLWHRHARPDRDACTGCGLCTRICPHGCFTPNRL